MWRRWGAIGLGYFGIAAWLTWPALLSPAELVPGAERTDLWNSLWSFWWATQSLSEGQFSLQNSWLDHPDGGRLLISDPLGVPLMWLLQSVMPLSAAYTVLIVSRLTIAGLLAHAFAEDWLASLEREVPRWGGAAWLAGLGYVTAPILISAVHNGASESTSGGYLVLAVWMCWRAVRQGGVWQILGAVLSLVAVALASWYGAVGAFLFAGSLAVMGTGEKTEFFFIRRVLVVVLGVALVAPLGMGVKEISQGNDNLVLIKNDQELRLVRRSTGPADPLVLIRGGDFRSPDFRKISRYGENFFHCSYLGWVLLVLAFAGLRSRRKGTGFLWLGGGIGLLLALGPVLVHGGTAVVLALDSSEGPDFRAFPLPYFLVERLPGFSSLSLVYRLVQGPALALALLAAVTMAGRRPRWIVLALLALLAEARFIAPTRASTGTADASISPQLDLLAEAEDGAVMNFPVVGGRAYLYEQTVHQKPIAGTLNFPNNVAARKVWKSMADHLVDEETGEFDVEAFRLAVQKTAKKEGVRYVVLHLGDADARPDMHDQSKKALQIAFEPLRKSQGSHPAESVEVYPLW